MAFKKDEMNQLIDNFNEAAQVINGVEVWSARDLQSVLDYNSWDKFGNPIARAKQACENSGIATTDHFSHVGKMVKLGSGSEREVDDIMLTRYAAYLLAQNCDPSKENAAIAQSYFSVQTRKQELVETRMLEIDRLNYRKRVAAGEKVMSAVCLGHDVKPHELAIVKSEGDKVYFGGNSTADMKERLEVPPNKPLADYLPTVALSGKEFALNLTAHVVREQNVSGVAHVTDCHRKSNQVVRNAALEVGIKFEDLPASESIQKVQRRIKVDEKALVST